MKFVDGLVISGGDLANTAITVCSAKVCWASKQRSSFPGMHKVRLRSSCLALEPSNEIPTFTTAELKATFSALVGTHSQTGPGGCIESLNGVL